MNHYDAIIIGAGPAGAQCALWLKQLGYEPCVIDAQPQAGGLLCDNPYPLSGMVCMAGQPSGQQLAADMQATLLASQVCLKTSQRVTRIGRYHDQYLVESVAPSGVSVLQTRHVVIASGVKARDGGILASDRIMIGPGSRVHAHDWRGLRVAIVGGGDNAFENFLFIRDRHARSVHLFARSVHARQQFRKLVPAAAMTIGDYEVDAPKLAVNSQSFDRIVVMYGWEPRLDFTLDGLLRIDQRGFVSTEPASCETSVTNLYAIGEVAGRQHPSCATAMADGVVAAKAIQLRLENS